VTKITVDLDDDFLARIAAAADARGVSRDLHIAELISRGLAYQRRPEGVGSHTPRDADYADRRRRDASRAHALGKFGERVAKNLLESYQCSGLKIFQNAVNFNETVRANYKYADLSAERIFPDKIENLIISVKTRNRYITKL
jgi:hypothetical protein